MMEEYFQMGHAELIPTTDLEKSQQEVFYLPMHADRSRPVLQQTFIFDMPSLPATKILLPHYEVGDERTPQRTSSNHFAA